MWRPQKRSTGALGVAALLATVAGLACGDRAASDGDDDAGTETTDSSDATDTGPDACEPPEGDEPGPKIATITIRNAGAQTIYVIPYSSIGCNYSQVEILIGGEPAHWDHARVYAFTCDQCGSGCSDGGDLGLIINPGATAEVPWNGSVWTSTALSEACAMEACENVPGWGEDNPLPAECEVLLTHDSVDYVARAHVGTECPFGENSAECDCAQDVCEAFFYEPQPSVNTVEASATFPVGAEIVVN